MSGAGGTDRTDLRLEIYGMSGLRELIRSTLRLTYLVRLPPLLGVLAKTDSPSVATATEWEIRCARALALG